MSSGVALVPARTVPGRIEWLRPDLSASRAADDFQTRYGVPLVSTKDEGSMDPPSDFWHSNGAVDVSMNGPWGWEAVATEMHSSARFRPHGGVVEHEVPPDCSDRGRPRVVRRRPTGRLGRALPTAVQWVRSVDSMIWMLPSTEFVA